MGRPAKTELQKASEALDKVKARIAKGGTLSEAEVACLKELEDEVKKLRDTFIYLAVESGIPAKDVSVAFNLSPGRISQIVTKVRRYLI